jgi:hypothetical protein
VEFFAGGKRNKEEDAVSGLFFLLMDFSREILLYKGTASRKQ